MEPKFLSPSIGNVIFFWSPSWHFFVWTRIGWDTYRHAWNMFRNENVVFYKQQCVCTANARLEEVCSSIKLLHHLSLSRICWKSGTEICGWRTFSDHENKKATIAGILLAAFFQRGGIACQELFDMPKSSETELKVQGTVKHCTYHHISGETLKRPHIVPYIVHRPTARTKCIQYISTSCDLFVKSIKQIGKHVFLEVCFPCA